MSYRRLGRTALRVGPIAMGSVNFGWNTDEAESFRMMDFALDHGLNLIDTADLQPRAAPDRVRSSGRAPWRRSKARRT